MDDRQPLRNHHTQPEPLLLEPAVAAAELLQQPVVAVSVK